ncbi:MAG: glycosyltransferase family 4 protein [Candidatus Sungbacteria bacterium]|nr:glycosyltransferase family 4 protein [Candidatus Sungbacteria bacterium]
MNIAIIHSRLNSKGGTQRHVLAMACALQDLGHRVTVYAMAYDREKCYPSLLSQLKIVSLAGYDTEAQKVNLPFLKFLNYFLYSRNETREAARLAKMIESGTEILCPFDRLAYRTAVYYKKNIRAICSIAIMDDIYLRVWAEWRKSQFDPQYVLPLRRKFFYKIIDWYESRKYILPHERFVVLDTRTMEWAKKFFKKDADIVRNGLDLQGFPFFEHSLRQEKHVCLLSTGIFFLHRRYEDILHAVKILRSEGIDAELALVGGYSGEHRRYYEALKKLAEELGIGPRVFFLGNVSDAELLEQYKKGDIYISANHLQSWGLAPFEAMASGMPTIISNSTGAAEVLTDRVNALLIPSKSPEHIASAVRELLEKPELYAALARSGRKLVETEITWQNTARGLERIMNNESRIMNESFHNS